MGKMLNSNGVDGHVSLPCCAPIAPTIGRLDSDFATFYDNLMNS